MRCPRRPAWCSRSWSPTTTPPRTVSGSRPSTRAGTRETFAKYVNTLRSGGDLPTIIQLSEISLQQMIDSRSIVPIDDCIAADDYDLDDFPELLLDQYRVDGRLVTMPFQLANPVLFYDGNDFVAAGLDPDDPPATLDDLVETSRALVEAGAVTSGIALEVDAWPFEQWVATAGAALVDHDNGRSGRAEQALLDDQAVTDLLTTLAEMNDEGLLSSTGRGGEQAALAQFVSVAQGDAAMTIASSATLGEIYEQIGRVPDVDIRVGPFPVAADGHDHCRRRLALPHERDHRRRAGGSLGSDRLVERARAAGALVESARGTCRHGSRRSTTRRCSSCGPTGPDSGSRTTRSRRPAGSPTAAAR